MFHRVMWAAAAASALIAHETWGQCTPEWSAMSSGMGGVTTPSVSAFAEFDDGSGAGPQIYAAGQLATAGGKAANHIARWNGREWSPVGGGMNSRILCLQVFDDGSGPALYAGGLFTEAGGKAASRIARWDGNEWSPVAGGLDRRVTSMAVFDDGKGPALYVGGDFYMAGREPIEFLARWTGEKWQPVGAFDEFVDALHVFDDGSGPELIVGGHFTTVDGVTVNHIARWDGARWADIGGGTAGGTFGATVFGLASMDTARGPVLYAGGFFSMAGGVAAERIAQWDGSKWNPLGSGVGGTPLAVVGPMAVFDDGSGDGPALYVGGIFTTAGGIPVNHVARWDGDNWSALDGGVVTREFGTSALAVLGSRARGGKALYVGGHFTEAGGVPANYIARWGCEPRCYADCDGSGGVDFFDFLCFQDLFAKGSVEADCNEDGLIDFFDFLCFQDTTVLGCP